MVVAEVIIFFTTMWLACSIINIVLCAIEDKRLSRWNMFGLTRYCAQSLADLTLKIRFKPLTEVEKEIREQEREIADLRKQKDNLDKLADLKRDRERLFREVNEDDEKSEESRRLMRSFNYCPECGTGHLEIITVGGSHRRYYSVSCEDCEFKYSGFN